VNIWSSICISSFGHVITYPFRIHSEYLEYKKVKYIANNISNFHINLNVTNQTTHTIVYCSTAFQAILRSVLMDQCISVQSKQKMLLISTVMTSNHFSWSINLFTIKLNNHFPFWPICHIYLKGTTTLGWVA
jgi:hypothetical protein